MESASSASASSPMKDAQNTPLGASMRAPSGAIEREAAAMPVFTPITRPQASISGPPLLPGLMSALCWTMRSGPNPQVPSTTRPTLPSL